MDGVAASSPLHPSASATPLPHPPSGPLSGSNSDLWEACMVGDLEAAVAALDEGADSNCRNSHGLTPLIVCCGGMGPPSLVAELLNRGADPNARDKAGWTPLIFVASSGQLPLIELLLARPETDVAAVSSDKGWTALTRAAYRGHSAACLRLLTAVASTAETGIAGSALAGAGAGATAGAGAGAGAVASPHLSTLAERHDAIRTEGKTALDWAKLQGHGDCAEALENALGRNARTKGGPDEG